MKSAPWKDLKHRIREQEGRLFEREAERLLRLRFPNIIQTPARQRLDKAGIDLVTRDEHGAIDVAVQCKGFEVSLPGPDQFRQARESIAAFASSKETARLFVFVHNRDGRSREFEANVRTLLNDLVSSGKCQAVEYFDLDMLMNSSRDVLRAHLKSSLRTAAKNKLAELRGLFEVVGDPLMDVPATENQLFINLTSHPRFEEVSPTSRRNVRELVTSRSDAKFTLLIGNFGTGKSTAGLLAANSEGNSEPTIIFAECAYFLIDRLGSGLTVLLEEALKASGVFNEIPERDHELFHLAAPLLREQLGNRGEKLGAEHQYVLILDGLDENRLYARPEGMAILINSLADLHCPIVLTTRREHLFATFESMKTGFLVFGKKHGARKPIRVFSLEPWSREDVRNFVEGSARTLEQDGRTSEADRLTDFLRILDEKRDKDFYGELSSHPLFLRLILDDIVANGIRQVGRAKLLRDWSLYKINRDLKSKAQNANQGWHFDRDFADRIMNVMEETAFQMTEDAAGGRVLTEHLDRDTLERLAHRHFPTDPDVAVTVLLNSLLVPRYLFQDSKFTVHFIYRVFHEFFLACYAVRRGIALDIPGTQVAEFIGELRSQNFGWASTAPKRIL